MSQNTINVLFICSCLEPGKDGVGDYTRKLACMLINLGHKAAIIALNDRILDGESWTGVQNDEGRTVHVLRLSDSIPWRKRMVTSKKFVQDFEPLWISLQYVPFGYHLKGLPFNLAGRLKNLYKKNYWHIMFHELSVNRYESFKFRLWAMMQVRIIRSIIKKLHPTVIHTNTELYQYRVKEMGFDAKVLALFSNISKTSAGDKTIFNEIIPWYLARHRDQYIIGTLFGSFDYKRWDMRSLLNKFRYSFSKKRIVIVSVGRMSAGRECWEQLKAVYPHIEFINLGEQSQGFISYWLSNYTDFGILTTLPELSGKSGSFMAFKEHGVPVVCMEETESLSEFNLQVDNALIIVKENQDFILPGNNLPVSVLTSVAEQFINDLKMNTR